MWGNLPAMTCLRQLTSSLWMTGRQSGSLIISLSSLMVKATCSGPRLPTKYTFRTRLLESASRACWDISVFYNTNRGKKYKYNEWCTAKSPYQNKKFIYRERNMLSSRCICYEQLNETTNSIMIFSNGWTCMSNLSKHWIPE